MVRERHTARAGADTSTWCSSMTGRSLSTSGQYEGAGTSPSKSIGGCQGGSEREVVCNRRGDPAYRAQLRAWTNRPRWSGDGVPVDTAVANAPRRVDVRDFTLDGTSGMAAGDGGDRGAVYAILHGPDDTPAGWLRGGQALSAVHHRPRRGVITSVRPFCSPLRRW